MDFLTSNTAILLYLVSVFVVFAGDDRSLILSTKRIKADATSDDIFTDFKNDRIGILVLCSLDGHVGESDITLDAKSFSALNLTGSVTIDENCVLLHETIKKAGKSLNLKVIKTPELISSVSKGLWLYSPTLDSKTVSEFGKLFAKVRKDNQITFIVTTCGWDDLLVPESNGEDHVDDIAIRATPVIVQQIAVLLLFTLILAMGLFYTLDVKTPSALLTPQQIHKKKVN